MAITSTQQTDILKVVAGLFNAAPGGNYLTEMANLVEGGMTISQLADALAAHTLFTGTVMAGKVTTAAQVAVLMDNFGLTVGNTDATSADAQAEAYFTSQIDAGVGFGQIVFDAVTFLSGSPATEFTEAATLLANKALVAAAYSATTSSNDLGVLQNVLSNVAGTAPYTQADIDAILSGSGSGSFTLTVNQDTASAINFEAPIFTASATGAQIQTLTSVDKLTGTGAADVLNAILNATEASTKPILTGVETVNLTGITAASTFDAANSTGISAIGSVDSSIVGDLLVRNVGSAATVNFKGAAATATAADLTVQFANTLVGGTTDAVSIVVNNVGQGATAVGTVFSRLNVRGETTGGFETLNVNSTGAASRLLSIGSDVAVTNAALTATNAVKTLNVTGTANLRVDNVLLNTNTVDANAFEGNLRVMLDPAQNTTVTGGKGDDYFDFTVGLSNNDTVEGGDGRDTIAVTANTGLGDGNKVTNAEILRNDGAAAATIFDLSKVASFDAVVHNSVNTATYNNLSKAGASDAAKGVTQLSTGIATVAVKDANALGSNNDTLQVKVGDAAQVATFVAGGIVTNAIEKIVVDVKDAGANTATAAGAFLTADAALTSVEFTGGSLGVAFNAGAVAGSGISLTNIDGSAFLGNLTVSGNAFSQVIKGGSGNDVLFTGGHAAFALGTVADTQTGGSGNDKFSFNGTGVAGSDALLTGANLTAVDAPAAVAATNRGEITAISDLNLGGATAGLAVDTIRVNEAGGAAGTLGAVVAGNIVVVNGGAATALTGADLGVAVNTLVNGGTLDGAGAGFARAGLFTWSGDTYLIAAEGTTAANNFGAVAGADIIIKVTGVTGTLDASDFVFA